jgi:hypothetical protein
MINDQPTGAELRLLRAEAARVREQNAEREQVVDLTPLAESERIAS